jgi:putative ABC transport system permease protein
MSTFLQDIRYAFRTLAKTPGVALIAIVTLGLGIGATTTVFSCVNALFLRPFPYTDPLRLMALRSDNHVRGWIGSSTSYPNFIDWQQQARSFSGMAAYTGTSFNMAGGNEPERVEGEAVSWNTFGLLGIAPMMGRDFGAADGRVGAPSVVMLSAGLWERRFGRDSTVLGRAITLNGKPYTVVGVMPAPHQFPDDAQLWVPIAQSPTERRGWNGFSVVGRLRDDVTLAQANAELAGIAARLAAQYPDDNKDWSASVVPLREDQVGEYKTVLQLMMGAVAFVLLIACANVANLLLSRAAARQREMAIRAALGAGWVRIVRQLLTESVLLALAGAAIGIMVALWGLDLIVAAVPSDKPFWMVFTIDARVLAFTAAVAVTTGVLFGLAPAWQVSRVDMHDSLKEGSRGAGTGSGRQRLRHALVVAEVALSIILLVGAALMIQSFLRLQRVDPGFDRRNILASTVVLSGSRYDSTRSRSVFFEDLLPRLRGLPGVAGVAASQAPPLSGSSSVSSLTIEGQPRPDGEEIEASFQAVTGGYVTLLGIPLQQGRDLTDRDVRDSAPVAVINRTMAERFWPGQDVLGKRFHFGGATESDNDWITVVGVAGDVRHQRLAEPPANQVYLPYSKSPYRGMVVLLKTVGDPAALAPAMRREFRAVDPSLPVFELQTMADMYRSSVWEQRLYSTMFGTFAGVALLLAAVGLYSVMAYMVTLRTHEIGVRMALGAQRSDMLRLVVRQGIRLTALGVAIGLVGAFAVTGTLKNFLFGVTPSDPLTFLGIPLVLSLVALLASWIPARRATRVDPMLALRYE